MIDFLFIFLAKEQKTSRKGNGTDNLAGRGHIKNEEMKRIFQEIGTKLSLKETASRQAEERCAKIGKCNYPDCGSRPAAERCHRVLNELAE